VLLKVKTRPNIYYIVSASHCGDISVEQEGQA